MKSKHLFHGVIRHPNGFTGQEWIPVSSTGMTGGGSHVGLEGHAPRQKVMPPCEIQTSILRGDPASALPKSHAGLDPASMQFYRIRVDSRVRHGNDKKKEHENDRKGESCGTTPEKSCRPVKSKHLFYGVIRHPPSRKVMPDVIRHPCGFLCLKNTFIFL